MAELLTIEPWIALLTLTSLEIVLGIDNLVFIAVITGRLDEKVQPKARRIGLLGAMGVRIVLLLGISFLMKLTEPLLHIGGLGLSGKDVILLAGGGFLIAKATYEIHHKLETADDVPKSERPAPASFSSAIVQIMLIDMVFSLDSVITAVGMAKQIWVMIAAIVIAVLVMMIFAESVSSYVEKHPTLKMLALSFLILIGVLLVADGLHQHLDRAYVYFAMGFAFVVELLNLRVRALNKRRDTAARRNA